MTARHRHSLAAALLAGLLVGCLPGDDVAAPGSVGLTASPDPSPLAIDPPPPVDALPATVERVVDGDTVIVDLNGVRERVRLLRIDTPELAREGDPAECLATEASDALARLLPAGTSVLVARDVEQRDRFERLLAHIWTDGTWVNGQMLRDGWAQVVTFPPNTAYDDEVLAAQQTGRDADRGLWDPAACG